MSFFIIQGYLTLLLVRFLNTFTFLTFNWKFLYFYFRLCIIILRLHHLFSTLVKQITRFTPYCTFINFRFRWLRAVGRVPWSWHRHAHASPAIFFLVLGSRSASACSVVFLSFRFGTFGRCSSWVTVFFWSHAEFVRRVLFAASVFLNISASGTCAGVWLFPWLSVTAARIRVLSITSLILIPQRYQIMWNTTRRWIAITPTLLFSGFWWWSSWDGNFVWSRPWCWTVMFEGFGSDPLSSVVGGSIVVSFSFPSYRIIRIPRFRFHNIIILHLASLILPPMLMSIIVFINHFKRFLFTSELVRPVHSTSSTVSCFLTFVSRFWRWIWEERIWFRLTHLRSFNTFWRLFIFHSFNFKRHFTIFFPFSQKM